ncbi:MAG: hypothetical protein N2376_07840 [Clostridia bacterium]|nr:hypothetical protein [Clostridia bacterium]
MKQILSQTELLNILSDEGEATVGGSQNWYPIKWQRISGCGPTAASNLMWYMIRSQPELQSLSHSEQNDRNSFVALMSEIFTFITPGMGGVNTSTIFTEGALKYAAAHGVALKPHVMEIRKRPFKRPSSDEVSAFIHSALQANKPVAFLNLSNGKLTNLESWHWVTIIALETVENTGAMTALITDQGLTFEIDLTKWLKTSILGGALVWFELEPKEGPSAVAEEPCDKG